jgi:hypothetical protein
MAIIPRQTGLLSAENWKKVYQTFREANFVSYDFETLRKSMIDYIKLNYPEDFNDFTESSEFIALVDLIAFFGQSLAFRGDLNARENFMDTAERRDSILKLARLVSYNPKRTQSASGFLRIDSVSTTERINDSDGIDISNTVVSWNDPGNDNWLEQFTAIVNASMVNNQSIGKPANTQFINGVRTDEYSINVTNNVVPVFRYSSVVDGNDVSFEVTSGTSSGRTYVYESNPDTNRAFNMLYMNDGLGNGSNNTGFFLYFKQGELKTLDFSISEVVPNKIVNIDVANINNSDVWLYSLDSTGRTETQWRAVPAVAGVNVIYSNVEDRNLYQINSRANDQISLVFGDGVFTTLPQGNFRLYYRVANGLTYRISPDEMQGVQVGIDYVSRSGRIETITFTASLRYTVANASARESLDDIKQKAPQQYYTQNRMVTGEDYNILPFTNYGIVAKVKATNRTSSGISRYLDTLDSTGKYSSTNIFCDDGVIYREDIVANLQFSFIDNFEIRKFIFNRLIPDIIDSKEVMHVYYSKVQGQRPAMKPYSAASMVNNEIYRINFVGTTDFTKFGALSNSENLEFVSANAGNQKTTYTVTANPSHTAFEFSNNIYRFNPTLRLKVGDVVTFNIATPGYPMYIKTNSLVGTSGLVTSGKLSANGIDVGTITWDTTNVPPGTYYYSASTTALAMQGEIIIDGYGNGEILSKLRWNLSTVGDSAATGYFMYNSRPEPLVSNSAQNSTKYLVEGALIRFVPPENFHFNSARNIVPGPASQPGDTIELYAAITKVIGDGSNLEQGNLANGQGPVSLSAKIPHGAYIDSIIPVFKNSLSDPQLGDQVDANEATVDRVAERIGAYLTFGLDYSEVNQRWIIIPPEELVYNQGWLVKFEYSNFESKYLVYYRNIRYVFHSRGQTNFFYDRSLKTYDSFNNTVIKDNIKILKSNSRIDQDALSRPLGVDYEWEIYKPVVRSDGFVDSKIVYLTFADSNEDSVPDYPNLFEKIVQPDLFPATKRVFFQLVTSPYVEYKTWRIIDRSEIITNYQVIAEVLPVINNYDVGQLFYASSNDSFYRVQYNFARKKVLSPALSPNIYRSFVGMENLFFQYRHNTPDSNRIDPSISNIIDIYVLTNAYNSAYRSYVADTSYRITEPVAPTSTELAVDLKDLEKFKTISDTMVFHSAKFKPVFGEKAHPSLQATFKVVKNPSLNLSDSDVKTSVINAINTYFEIENWDFGETFYFSELAAYLHKVLNPNVASIVIVPKDPSADFGQLYQINAEANEIIISAATVNDVEIITSITATQLNLSITNKSVST